MSAIAEILAQLGYTVRGSDQKESANVRRLRARGMKVFIGHDPANIVGRPYVVMSSAVKPGNVELEAARAKGLTIIRRAEMLAELMRFKRTVSVTGTHGKTTTTSLIAHLLEQASLDPTVITGGIIQDWGSNARLGEGDWMVVEADESDGTFTKLPSEVGIVTNIDPEHLDHFGSVERMHEEFATFLKNIPFYGLAVACIDHPVVRQLLAKLDMRNNGRRLLTYGEAEDADLKLQSLRFEGRKTLFDVALSARVKGGARRLEGWMIPVPGAHNAFNALAAIAAASEAGITDASIRASLASFSGVKRRFEPTGSWNGVGIFDDYAHHPAEIGATLKAARAATRGRVIAVMQPHRYTRLRDLFDDFAGSFIDADAVVVTPMYSAGEAPITGIDHTALAARVAALGHPQVRAIASEREIAPLLRDWARPGDSVVCLGAGTITDWANALQQWLSEGDRQLAAPLAGSAL